MQYKQTDMNLNINQKLQVKGLMLFRFNLPMLSYKRRGKIMCNASVKIPFTYIEVFSFEMVVKTRVPPCKSY